MNDEFVGVVFDFQGNYPNLASLDPVSILREVVVEIGKLVDLVMNNHTDNYCFGYGILRTIMHEYSLVDPDHVVDQHTALQITQEAKRLTLDVMDSLRSREHWYVSDLSLMNAEYTKPPMVGNVVYLIRATKRDGAHEISHVKDIECSDYLMAATKILIGR